MAMTKAEKQRMEESEKEVRLARALRYSTYAPPKKILASREAPEITGYLVLGSAALGGWASRAERAITEAWSTTVTHGQGKRDGRLSGSQGGRALYRTKHDALIGLRLEKERDFAAALADIDRAIEAAAKEEIVK
jgi:hypothetical protein